MFFLSNPWILIIITDRLRNRPRLGLRDQQQRRNQIVRLLRSPQIERAILQH